MIQDVRTVLWKEARSLFRQPGSKVRTVLTVVVPVGFFGVVAPLQEGAGYAAGAMPWFVAVILPLLSVSLVAPDSFAGERERGTLRTLLSSRLPDGAILYGKLLFSIFVAMVMFLATLSVALITVNLATSGQGPILIGLGRLAAMLGTALLLACLASALAVLVSLRAATVQQAQQTLVAVLFLVPTVLGPVAFLLADSGSDVVEKPFSALASDVGRAALVVLLAVVTGVLLRLAHVRFQRHRLANLS